MNFAVALCVEELLITGNITETIYNQNASVAVMIVKIIY